jgi:hypothetical protein
MKLVITIDIIELRDCHFLDIHTSTGEKCCFRKVMDCSGSLKKLSNSLLLREELFERGEMSELTCFKPEPRAYPISQPAR